MAIQTITYQDKEFLNQNASIPDINKCNDTDMNEIKSVVNANANNIGDLSNLTTPSTDNLVNAINSIVESGSNTNGNYIKYADGTMICSKNITGDSSFALWYSPIIFVDISIGSWAETFVSINSVLGTNNTTQTGILNINNFTITDGGTARIIGFNTSATTKAYNFTVVAIGKWK